MVYVQPFFFVETRSVKIRGGKLVWVLHSGRLMSEAERQKLIAFAVSRELDGVGEKTVVFEWKNSRDTPHCSFF